MTPPGLTIEGVAVRVAEVEKKVDDLAATHRKEIDGMYVAIRRALGKNGNGKNGNGKKEDK